MGIVLAIGVATFGLVIAKATSWPDRPLVCVGIPGVV
jgi:hypothetical protein